MGHVYNNLILVGVGVQDIARPIREIEWSAYISPVIDGNVVVFDDNGRMDVAEASTDYLSGELNCPVWTVLNHDDDVLYGWLYEGGECISRYISSPNNFSHHFESDAPYIENLDALLRAFDASHRREEIESVMRFDKHAEGADNRYVWEVARHRAILDLLRLPWWAAGCGFHYMKDGEFPEGYSRSDFTKIS